MLIIIDTPPESEQSRQSINRAAELAADIVLTGPAVAFAAKGMLSGFCGTAFALEEDLEVYLPKGAALEKGVKVVSKQEMELLPREEGRC